MQHARDQTGVIRKRARYEPFGMRRGPASAAGDIAIAGALACAALAAAPPFEGPPFSIANQADRHVPRHVFIVSGNALLSSYGLLSPAATVAALLTGAALGMLVLATQATRFLDRHFAEFRSAKLFAAGLFALGTYVAHGRAVVEVNGIFGEDAAAFPHAVAAASAMFVATWTLWAAVHLFVDEAFPLRTDSNRKGSLKRSPCDSSDGSLKSGRL
ncbi:hypothetical protein [Massilia sp. TSP1-1-2]|uniref:hypothetical protein n=1 Tax=Massilia sp. TSP1-1-2 TaxID=2804649 RepID=UPI003CF4C9DE